MLHTTQLDLKWHGIVLSAQGNGLHHHVQAVPGQTGTMNQTQAWVEAKAMNGRVVGRMVGLEPLPHYTALKYEERAPMNKCMYAAISTLAGGSSFTT